MIEVKNLKKTYHNKHDDFVALSNMNFKLGNKGVVFLFGESGEGKSTLLNVLSGLDVYDDDGGQVLYNGKDIMTMSQKERDAYRSKEVGLVFERDNLIDNLTVEENVRLAKEISGGKVTQTEVSMALKTVKMTGYESRKLYELSSGQLQRVAIARILLLQPKVLFVDEPTGHLDHENSKLFWEIIKKQSKKCLVVAITHEKDIVDAYADRVIEISKGRVVSDTYISKTLEKEDKKLFKTEIVPDTTEVKRTFIPAKTSAKLGLQVLTASKFKFISMLVLTCFTLMMFALSFLLMSFSPSTVMAKSATMEGLDYITYVKDNGAIITDADIVKIYENGLSTAYYKIYSTDLEVKFSNATSFKLGGFMEVKQGTTQVNALGQKILHGKYPAQTEPNKIAISDYFARLMSVNGIDTRIDSTTYSLYKNDTMENLIGRQIQIGGKWFEISGIYETDYAEYVAENTLKPTDRTQNDFQYNFDNIYSMVHCATDSVDAIIRTETVRENLNITFKSEQIGASIVRTVNVAKFDTADSNVNLLSNEKTTLAKNEVVLTISLFNQLFNANIDTTTYADDATVTGFITNSLITVKSAYGEEEKYTVVGVTKGTSLLFAENDANNQVALTGCVGGVIKSNAYPVLKIASQMTNSAELQKTIEAFTQNGLSYTSKVSADVEEVTDFIDVLRIVFAVTTVFSAIFSMYFMFTFFASVISHRKKAIGVLRSLGANTYNLIGIFMVSCLVLMVTSVIGATILSAIASTILNSQITAAFCLPLSILNLNFGMFGYMALIGIGITFIGSIIPILIYCRKTPVDVIKR